MGTPTRTPGIPKKTIRSISLRQWVAARLAATLFLSVSCGAQMIERDEISDDAPAILLAIGIPACMLFSGSSVLFFRGKTFASFLQLLGAGCLMVVVFTHVAEAFRLFPGMNWGLPHSVGHYVDLGSAVLGVTLFPLGYLFYAVRVKTNMHQAGSRH